MTALEQIWPFVGREGLPCACFKLRSSGKLIPDLALVSE